MAAASVLQSDHERSTHDRDWHLFPRDVIHQTQLGRPKPRHSLLTKIADDRLRGQLDGPSGLLVQVRKDDGMSWSAEAVLETAATLHPESEIRAFGGGYSEGDLPQVVDWVGVARAFRVAKRTGLLRSSLSAAARARIYVSAVAATALAAIASRWVLDQTTTPVSEDLLSNATLVVALGAVATFVARRVEGLLDAKEDPREALRAALGAAEANARSSRSFNEFANGMADRIQHRRSSRIVVVDDFGRLSQLDRAVLHRLLDAVNPDRRCPWEFWVVFERQGEPNLVVKAIDAGRGSLLYTLSPYIVMPLTATKRRELAARHGVPGAERLEAVKLLVNARSRDETIAHRFGEAVRLLNGKGSVNGKGSGTTALHLLWLLAVDASAGESVGSRLNQIRSYLSSHGPQRNQLLQQILPGGIPDSTFVDHRVRALMQEWPEAFDDIGEDGRYPLVRLRVPAALAIVETASDANFGDHEIAAAYWIKFWHDRCGDDRHPARLRKLVDHLVQLLGDCPNVDRLDMRLDGTISAATAFAVNECIATAQMTELPELLMGLGACETATDPRDLRRVAALGYQLTRDPDVLTILPPSMESGPNESRLCRQRLQRAEELSPDARATAHDLLAASTVSMRAVPELEEHAFRSLLALFTESQWHTDMAEKTDRVEGLATLARSLQAAVQSSVSVWDDDQFVPSPADHADLAMELLALSTAVWTLPFTRWCDGWLKDAEILRGQLSDDMWQRVMRELGPGSALDLLEDASLAVGVAFDVIEREQRGGGNWSVAVDAAAQELALMCLLAVALIQTQTTDGDNVRRLRGIRDLLCEPLNLPNELSLSRLMQRTELAVLVWRALGLDRVAASTAQRLDLTQAALARGDQTHEPRAIIHTSRGLAEHCFTDMARGLSDRDNRHLRTTYFSRAAWTFLSSRAAREYRLEVGLRSVLASHGFTSIDLVPTVTKLVDEFGPATVTGSIPDSQLSDLTVAFANITREADDDVRGRLINALIARVERCEDDDARRAAEVEIGAARLEHSLRLKRRQCFGDIRSTLSLDDDDQGTFPWILSLACRSLELFDDRDEAQRCVEEKLGTYAAAGSASWNELYLASNYLSYIPQGSARDTALDVLAGNLAYLVARMPISFAQRTLLLLEREDRIVGLEHRDMLEARYIEQQAASVFPHLREEGRHFEVLDTYLTVLERHGLAFLGTQQDWDAVAQDCDDLLLDARNLDRFPDPVGNGRVSAYFVSVGRCLARRKGKDAFEDDDLDGLQLTVDRAALVAVPTVLEIGIGLDKVPNRVKSVLRQHLLASEDLAER